MKLSTILSFSSGSFAGLSFVSGSTNVTYRVVQQVPSNYAMGVIVDSALYPLSNADAVSTLYHVGEAPRAYTGYKYAIINKNGNIVSEEENFSRNPIPEKDDSTLNEYYNRTWNILAVDKLPVIMKPLSIINRTPSDLHLEGQIPTIHITGNQTAFDIIHSNAMDDIDVPDVKMTYISPNVVKTLDGITLAVSGHSSRSQKKLSYKFKIPKGQNLFGYRRLKLRAMATDPSYMRDQLASDVAESIGIPTTQYSYVRVFINDRAIGLFGLAEAFQNPWIRNVFADSDKDFNQGAFYVADISAARHGGIGSEVPSPGPPPPGAPSWFDHVGPIPDLSYMGDNITHYTVMYPPKEDPSEGQANYTKIMDFTKFISEQPTSGVDSDASITLWKEKADIDSFMRGLAMEIVTSNSDGYFTMANNYILYDDLETGRLVFSSQDFDLTFGSTIFNSTLMNGGNYTEFPGFLNRPLAPALFAVPAFKREFESLLFNFTKYLVNPEILTPRIDQLYTMIMQDVAWDKTLPRVNINGRTLVVKALYEVEEGGAVYTSGFAGADDVEFDYSINGPSIGANELGLKEWIAFRSGNLLQFLQNQ